MNPVMKLLIDVPLPEQTLVCMKNLLYSSASQVLGQT
jgi:hypothetical protein